MSDDADRAPKHIRGSSPPNNVEDIYHSWLRRPRVPRRDEEPKESPAPHPEDSGDKTPESNPAEPVRD